MAIRYYHIKTITMSRNDTMAIIKKRIAPTIIAMTTLLMANGSVVANGIDKAEAKVSEANQKITVEHYVKDDGIPWGMAWLPSGDMLISMRGGQLRMVKEGKLLPQAIAGLPEIKVKQQGGLLDVVLHPDYEKNGWIYLSYSKEDKAGNYSTAIMRAKLKDMELVEQQDIYVAQAYDDNGRHFGSRMAFDNDGYLFFSIGDRADRDVNPQDITRDAGKVYRIHDDGRIPADNPFVSKQGAKTAIYSYGHRNPQGMAKHPSTGDIWTHEHGPRGGDEVNIVAKGKNYGWPVISYGINYIGTSFTDLTHKEGMEQPNWYWDPSIAPSGMTFVTSDKYKDWQGNVLVGSLKFGYIVMLTLDGNKIVKEAVVKDKLTRVRNVKQGPDGYIYVGVDGQGIYRLVP